MHPIVAIATDKVPFRSSSATNAVVLSAVAEIHTYISVGNSSRACGVRADVITANDIVHGVVIVDMEPIPNVAANEVALSLQRATNLIVLSAVKNRDPYDRVADC